MPRPRLVCRMPHFSAITPPRIFSARATRHNGYEHRWGNGDAHILDYYLHVENGDPYPASVEMDSAVTLYLKVLAHRDVEMPIFGLNIKTKEGCFFMEAIHGWLATDNSGRLWRGKSRFIKFKWMIRYNGGDYLLSVGLASGETLDTATALDRRYDSILLSVLPSRRFVGLADMELSVERFSAG